MKRRIVRTDLMSKSDYSVKYNVNRVTLDKKIKDGELAVEVISGKEYIILNKG
jgi:hypothetical protein